MSTHENRVADLPPRAADSVVLTPAPETPATPQPDEAEGKPQKPTAKATSKKEPVAAASINQPEGE